MTTAADSQTNSVFEVWLTEGRVDRAAAPALWDAALVFVWLSGSLIVGARQLRLLLRLRSVVRSAAPGPHVLNDEVSRLAKNMNMRSIPTVAVDAIASPFVWCLGPATIAWPAQFADEKQCRSMRGVIAHELAHVKRRDHWTAWLQFVAGILWWWNPLWRAVRRKLNASAEMACDAIAVEVCHSERRDYAEALLKLTALGPQQPALALGAKLRDRKSFERRLTMIMSAQATSRLSRRAFAALAVLAIAVAPNWRWDPAPASWAQALQFAETKPAEPAAKAAEPERVVAFYLAQDAPAPGLKKTELNEPEGGVVYLHAEPIVTGEDIVEVTVRSISATSEIGVEFSKSGAAKLSKATGENVGKRLAFVLDDKISSAPVIRSQIGGRARISGNFTRSQLLEIVATVLPAERD